MNTRTIVAIVLMAAGALGLLYGKFSFTKDTHSTQLGALELSIKDRETVNIPAWLGVAALVAGGVLLFVPGRRS